MPQNTQDNHCEIIKLKTTLVLVIFSNVKVVTYVHGVIFGRSIVDEIIACLCKIQY